ncbi:MAG: hypothetical protein D6679_00270 [Candidatus Hydrogenedentota bacterium]|nr:MAG: hypothetical protein D6679_00270 [Candidatus Hydrogenedentota bacterium]
MKRTPDSASRRTDTRGKRKRSVKHRKGSFRKRSRLLGKIERVHSSKNPLPKQEKRCHSYNLTVSRTADFQKTVTNFGRAILHIA